MSDFMEIDENGIKTDFKWNETDQEYSLIRTADVEPVLDAAALARNEGGVNRADIKKGWWHYASIPPIVQLQLRAKGINIHNKDDQKRMIEEINTNYPNLKMTTGRMGGRTKIIG